MIIYVYLHNERCSNQMRVLFILVIALPLALVALVDLKELLIMDSISSTLKLFELKLIAFIMFCYIV